ncbi:MAG: tRNA dihydrouridine synthase DusB [Clostridia bacterium]|nr:tRNA dihydrouridine synthase DusB [Clostridia bacterium]
MYLKKLKIGNVELENNLILAPMAGVTDLPFRVLCKEQGAGMVCTEMASSRAIFHNDEKTKQLINTDGEKRPISFQIFGSDEESMAFSAKEFSKFADIIDINMGCPAPKVVKNGDGSKLLLDLEKADKIIKAVVQNSSVPVTLKMRKGWDKEHIVAGELAKMAEKNGISAITVHGRTRTEFFSGEVDLEIIRKVKEAVSIPVIGNGNIVDEETAMEMFEKTGVDGIMIGRGSLGNPWIFRNIKHYLETGEKLEQPTLQERKEVMKRHIELCIQDKGENVAIHEIRKHISWYTKNLPNSSDFRNRVNHTENSQALIELVDEYFNSL